MYVSHVALDDFRSYRTVVAELDKGINILVGPNGQGKTNFIEALAFLTTLSSHRIAADSALIRVGEASDNIKAAVIRSKIVTNEREQVVEVEIVSGRANRARINRNPVRPRQIIGKLKLVVFAPEDLVLVKGEPAARRKFLDDLVVQFNPAMVTDYRDYDRILKQRGALLKGAQTARRRGFNFDITTLVDWNNQLVNTGASILAERYKVLKLLSLPVIERYAEISGQPNSLDIKYNSSLEEILKPENEFSIDSEIDDIKKLLRAALESKSESEIERGVNLVGPHRDDINFFLNGMLARGYASQGESWSVALALKLGAFTVLMQNMENDSDSPVLVLDDVFAELDKRRRNALVNLILTKAGQVLITASVPEDIPVELSGKIIKVSLDSTAGSLLTIVPENNIGLLQSTESD